MPKIIQVRQSVMLQANMEQLLANKDTKPLFQLINQDGLSLMLNFYLKILPPKKKKQEEEVVPQEGDILKETPTLLSISKMEPPKIILTNLSKMMIWLGYKIYLKRTMWLLMRNWASQETFGLLYTMQLISINQKLLNG